MNKLKSLLAVSFLLFVSVTATAQKGFLRGKIIEAATGEPLIGATILDVAAFNGVMSDFDGNFSLELDPGMHTIKVQFISFQTQQFDSIEIRSGEVSILNVTLSEATTEIDEVKVVARSTTRTEAAMQVQQMKSSITLDGISSQQISRLSDSDAASALKRVTGVTVEGGKYVYVRGLSDRYSKTTMNGAEIPGLDPNRNTVQMDLFPSNIIENMVIHKTFSPDLPANFTGGHVDIITKDFPERFSLSFSSSFGFNPNVNLNDEFITYNGGNKDNLGVDDGSRNIPQIVQDILDADDQIPYYYEDNELLGDISRSFNKEMDYKREKSGLDQSYSLAIGDQRPLFGKTFGYNASLSYSKDFSFYQDGEYARHTPLTPTSMVVKKFMADNRSSEEVIWAGLLNLNLKLNNNHKLGVTLLRNQSGNKNTRYNIGEEPDESRFIQERTLGWQERGLTTYQAKGKHVFPILNNAIFEWQGSMTNSYQNEPDLRFFYNDWIYDEVADDTTYTTRANKESARFYRKMTEDNYDVKANFTQPVTLLGQKGKIKAGFSYVFKERNSDEAKFNISRQGPVLFNGQPEDYLQDENAVSATNGYGVWFIQNSKLTDRVNSYSGEETVTAAYLLADMSFGEKLKANFGVRWEHAMIDIANKVDSINFPTQYENKFSFGDLDESDLLPALNITYTPIERMNVRAAFSRTLARPAFRELAPYASFDFKDGLRKVGNPELERTLIDNFDLRWEYFFAPGEMISLSGFYKHFNNPIELRDAEEAANPEIHFENIESSFLYGAELEARKNLDFINVLRDFQVGVNFTYIYSEVEEDSLKLVSARALDPDYPSTREMYGQSPYVVNAFLSYTNDNLGLSSNLGFNVSGKKIVLIGKGATPNVYEQPFPKLDFNISKLLFDKLTLKFSAKNLLNTEFRQLYDKDGFTNTYQRYYRGTDFSFSLSYAIR